MSPPVVCSSPADWGCGSWGRCSTYCNRSFLSLFFFFRFEGPKGCTAGSLGGAGSRSDVGVCLHACVCACVRASVVVALAFGSLVGALWLSGAREVRSVFVFSTGATITLACWVYFWCVCVFFLAFFFRCVLGCCVCGLGGFILCVPFGLIPQFGKIVDTSAFYPDDLQTCVPFRHRLRFGIIVSVPDKR